MKNTQSLYFDICNIDTIVKKHENVGFDFHNPCREWDGFVLFTEGSAVLRQCGKEDITVNRSDLVLLQKNDDYEFYSASACTYITAGFTFSDDSDEELGFLPRVLHCNSALTERICNIAAEWEKHRYDSAMACKTELLSLYLDLIRRHINGSNFDDTAVKLALDFLHENFKRNFSSAEISRFCSLSPSYLRSRFNAAIGMTITQYRDNLRLNAAKELLSGGVFSIKETAAELGFCDVYHFSKFFAAKCGITPARFAKKSSSKQP